MGENVEYADANDSLPQCIQTPGLTKDMQGKSILDVLKIF